VAQPPLLKGGDVPTLRASFPLGRVHLRLCIYLRSGTHRTCPPSTSILFLIRKKRCVRGGNPFPLSRTECRLAVFRHSKPRATSSCLLAVSAPRRTFISRRDSSRKEGAHTIYPCRSCLRISRASRLLRTEHRSSTRACRTVHRSRHPFTENSSFPRGPMPLDPKSCRRNEFPCGNGGDELRDSGCRISFRSPSRNC
jgi:hypothetical protein